MHAHVESQTHRGHQAGTQNSLQVFLCHSSDGKEAVRSLHDRLYSDGFNPWLDEKKILARPGSCPGTKHIQSKTSVMTAPGQPGGRNRLEWLRFFCRAENAGAGWEISFRMEKAAPFFRGSENSGAASPPSPCIPVCTGPRRLTW